MPTLQASSSCFSNSRSLDMYRLWALVFQPGAGPGIALPIPFFVAEFGLNIVQSCTDFKREAYAREPLSQTQKMWPMGTRSLEKRIRHTQQYTGFRRQFVDKKRMIRIMDREVWPNISCHGYLTQCKGIEMATKTRLTGRSKSLNHQIA